MDAVGPGKSDDAGADPPLTVEALAAALGAERPRRAQHTIRPGRLPRSARVAVGVTGLVAAAVAAWLGTTALITAPASTPSRPTTAEHITVSRPPMAIPLSDQQILALLDGKPDFGPLTDPQRRTSCLAGLGYPANARVLGARPVQIAGRPAVVLVLPADTPGAVNALAVAPSCSSADTGLLADRRLDRP